MKKLVLLRRIFQICFFCAFVFVLWSTAYPLHGKFPAEIFFKIDPLIMVVTSLSERIILPGMAFSFLMLFFIFILGRFFCGWICPLGSAVDFFAYLGGKKMKFLGLPPETDLPSEEKPEIPETEYLSGHNLSAPLRARFLGHERISAAKKTNKNFVKFAVLAGVLLFAFFGMQTAWIFDPLVISARFVSLNLIPLAVNMVDNTFAAVIRNLHLYGVFLDFYRLLKSTILGPKTYYFPHALAVFFVFLFAAGMSLRNKRWWCRIICPLGAMYALSARYALLQRTVENCVSCARCKSACRMQAIKEDMSYIKQECVLCMDCLYECSGSRTRFVFGKNKTRILQKSNAVSMDKLSRRQFAVLLGAGIVPLFLGVTAGPRSGERPIIRPPAALKEKVFLNRCIRCGNCMKVCPTNALQPIMFGAGLGGLWTPQLVPEIGYCEYNCNLCAQVCPTGAIKNIPLKEKQETRLGIAQIDRRICLPYAKRKECLVCEEHCPVPDKAIILRQKTFAGKRILIPSVEKKLCNGCAICQTKCPTRPLRAITVNAQDSQRL